MADLRDKGQAKADAVGVVTIDSPELLNELIQNNEKMLKELEELNIKKEDISVSEDGKIQFSNKALFEKVKDSLTSLEVNNDVVLANTAARCKIAEGDVVVANSSAICFPERLVNSSRRCVPRYELEKCWIVGGNCPPRMLQSGVIDLEDARKLVTNPRDYFRETGSNLQQ